VSSARFDAKLFINHGYRSTIAGVPSQGDASKMAVIQWLRPTGTLSKMISEGQKAVVHFVPSAA